MKGARKISLTFAPSPTALQMHQRRGAYNEKVNLDLAGLTMRYSGISKDIKFQNILDLDSAYDPWNYVKTQPLPIDASSKSRSKQIISTFSRAGLSDLADLIQDFDYHSLIVDTLRSYIQKATSNPNVIVLLPNINIICRNLINNTALETIPRFSEDDGTYPVPFNRMWSPTEKLQYKENFIKAFLEKLGLGFLFVHKALYVFGTDPKALPVGDITFKKDLEESTTPEERAKNRYEHNWFWATLEKADNKGIPNHTEAINSVINKILLNSQEEYRIEFGIFNETNTKVLDYWSGESLKDYPTFGGYNTFDTQREAVIVGDQALIRDYLYGRLSIPEVEKTAAEYQEKAVLAKKNMDKAKQIAKNPFEEASVAETPTTPTTPTTPLSDLSDLSVEDVDLFDITNEQVGGYDQPNLTEGLFSPIDNLVKSSLAAIPLYEKDYKHNLLQSITTIPIHPVDSILLDEGYQKGIQDLVSPLEKRGSAGFGNISDVPDFFAYDTPTTDEKNLSQAIEINARNKGISIFKYNTANPNILDMKFHYGGVYVAQLKLGFAKVIKTKASNVAMGVLPVGIGTLPIRTVGAAVAFLRNKNFSMNLSDDARQELLQELAGRLSPELALKLGNKDNQKAASLVAMTLAELEKNNDLGGVIEIDQFNNGDPQTVMTNFMEDMYRKALQMTITTLPSFHLSNNWDLNSPCLVYAQDAPISQTTNPKRTLMNNFFSGQYRILGYSHKITTSKSESTFKLAKNVISYGDSTDE